MQLHQKQLSAHLQQPLGSIYLLSSEVPFFLSSARSAIIKAAQKQGFLDKEIFHITSGFLWENLSVAMQNRSLFSQKKLIDIRNLSAKFDTQALKILSDYFAKLNDDMMLVISTDKLTRAQQKTRWFQLIIKHGIYLPIYPISTRDLPAWILVRAKKANLQLTNESANCLAQLSEGNSYAAQQAIEKLSLLYPNQTITPNKILHVMTDQAHFSVFDLSNAVLSGNGEKVTRILTGLQQLSVEPTLILWALAKELRDLITMKSQLEMGVAIHTVTANVWSSKKTLVQHALSHHTVSDFYHTLRCAAHVDAIIKGAKIGDARQALLSLCLLFSGIKHG